jgi:anti-anti-sigma regulatory factor
MFKIQRSADEKSVIFALSGRIKAQRLAELEKLMECEAGDHNLVLDLTDVKLVDRDVIGFLAGCQSTGVKLVNCPAYIREWIEREAAQREDG